MEDEQQAPPVGKRIGRWIKQRPGTAVVAGLLLVVFAIIVYWAIWADSSPPWTGFGAYNEEAAGPRAKTLWDWLGLLIVPAALAGGVYWLNRSQKETELKIAEKARAVEREIADNRQKQATLEAYYDRMTDLLLEQGLRESAPDSEVRSIARARTIAVVKSLDGERNGQLFSFLVASKLNEEHDPILNFARANLSEIVLSGANLSKVNLSWSELMKANLRAAELPGANLSGAFLYGANLSMSYLKDTNLRGADLTEADMRGADLRGANLGMAFMRKPEGSDSALIPTDLTKANLAGADLSEVKLNLALLHEANLRGAYINGANLSGSDLSKADLSNANLGLADLSRANLSNANLLDTYLTGAELVGTNLMGANLRRADLSSANLDDVENWTIEQFDQAKTFDGATMPGGVKLGDWLSDGPTYVEWKAQYLASHSPLKT